MTSAAQDVACQASTGSGKTLAFLIPALELVYRFLHIPPSKPSSTALRPHDSSSPLHSGHATRLGLCHPSQYSSSPQRESWPTRFTACAVTSVRPLHPRRHPPLRSSSRRRCCWWAVAYRRRRRQTLPSLAATSLSVRLCLGCLKSDLFLTHFATVCVACVFCC